MTLLLNCYQCDHQSCREEKIQGYGHQTVWSSHHHQSATSHKNDIRCNNVCINVFQMCSAVFQSSVTWSWIQNGVIHLCNRIWMYLVQNIRKKKIFYCILCKILERKYIWLYQVQNIAPIEVEWPKWTTLQQELITLCATDHSVHHIGVGSVRQLAIYEGHKLPYMKHSSDATQCSSKK